MAKPTTNLQDSFLNQVRKDSTEVKVSLLDGTMLRGVVRGFDNFTLILHVGGLQHLLYKHAIAQIIARRAPRREKTERPPEQTEQSAAEPVAAPPPEAKEPFNAMDLSGVQASETSPTPGEPQGKPGDSHVS